MSNENEDLTIRRSSSSAGYRPNELPIYDRIDEPSHYKDALRKSFESIKLEPVSKEKSNTYNILFQGDPNSLDGISNLRSRSLNKEEAFEKIFQRTYGLCSTDIIKHAPAGTHLNSGGLNTVEKLTKQTEETIDEDPKEEAVEENPEEPQRSPTSTRVKFSDKTEIIGESEESSEADGDELQAEEPETNMAIENNEKATGEPLLQGTSFETEANERIVSDVKASPLVANAEKHEEENNTDQQNTIDSPPHEPCNIQITSEDSELVPIVEPLNNENNATEENVRNDEFVDELNQTFKNTTESKKTFVEPLTKNKCNLEEDYVVPNISFIANRGADHSNRLDRRTYINGKQARRRTSSVAVLMKKSNKCHTCNHTVYLTEKIETDIHVFHKICFHCSRCGTIMSVGNWVHVHNEYYCDSCNRSNLRYTYL